MKKIILNFVFLLSVLFASEAFAVIAFVASNGTQNNKNNCTSDQAPFCSISVITNGPFTPGDVFILKDGQNYPPMTVDCNTTGSGNSGAYVTIRAQNERQVRILGTASTAPFYITNCHHVAIEGIHFQNVDSLTQVGGMAFAVTNGTFLRIRRNLITHSNRLKNAHLLQGEPGSGGIAIEDSLVEENEFYYSHRHGMNYSAGKRNIARRNYCNFRNWGTTFSEYQPGGCYSVYPGDNNILENNIAETAGLHEMNAQPPGGNFNNHNYGNIVINGSAVYLARGGALQYMPRDDTVENQVMIGNAATIIPGCVDYCGGAGIYTEGPKNLRITKSTFINIDYVHNSDSENTNVNIGDGQYTWFISDSLLLNNADTIIIGPRTPPFLFDWGVTNSRFFGNKTMSVPLSDSHITGETTTNPNMGECTLYAPAGSNLVGTGIGATVLMRYTNGKLASGDPVNSSERLWNFNFPANDARRGEPFGWAGAQVKGINDGSSGNSLFNVQTRLGFGTGTCPTPGAIAPTLVSITIESPTTNPTFITPTQGITISGTATGAGF